MSRKPASNGPVTVDEASALFASLRGAPCLLAAVSGGPDSVALMHLLSQVAQQGGWPAISVASVDHGLQPASRAIASRVVAEAEALGLDGHLLGWEGAKPKTGIQEVAREARYRLLCDLARTLGGACLLTAHTLDDQAETILFRMARGSGPAGLAGMRSSVSRGDIIHHRPLLGIAKVRLVETCRSEGWAFIDDPANADPRFSRARFRQILPTLAREGLNAEALARLGQRLARDEAALQAMAASARSAVASEAPDGHVVIAASGLLAQPQALALRILDQIMSDVAPDGTPRLGRLEDLLEQLTDTYRDGRVLRRTLRGLTITLDKAGILHLRREGVRKRGLTLAVHDPD